MAESEEELKRLSMKVKERSEKAGLKLNIQKTKIMASGPITSWQIDGETMGTVIDFIFLGSKITSDGDCSYEIKRHWLLGRKAMTNLDSILKSKHTHTHARTHTHTRTGWVTPQHMGSPRSGIKPVSPALAGWFFTTEPPEKPYSIYF